MIYRELSYRVMEMVFEVHNTLGPGFVESLYEEALAYELELRGMPFKRQLLSYLKAAGLKLGILINFGTPRVEYIRIVN